MQWLRHIGALNLLLIALPVALYAHWTHQSAVFVFLTACVAIIPMAAWMGRSTEMLAARLGPGIGGLLNATFGNAAELIIALIALRKGLTEVVKASITGSILGNLLLVLGASFFFGGLRFRSQRFSATVAGMSGTLLFIAVIGLLIPAVFHFHLHLHHGEVIERAISLQIAVVLFVSYLLMLIFSLRTHSHLYDPVQMELTDDADLKAEEKPHWPIWVSSLVLLISTIGVAVISELLVGAVEGARASLGMTEVFVGVIVIAIVGNAAEHSSAVLFALKNQMDLAYQIAVGSALQIALFVAPVLVFASYLPGFGRMDLVFTLLEVISVAAAVLAVSLVAYDGETNWFEGFLLIAAYVILAIAFFNLPHEKKSPADPQHAQRLSLPGATAGLSSGAV